MKKINLSLQGLRGLLALLVVIFHSYRGLVSMEIINPLTKSMYWVENLGIIAVNLFFVISGYLILQSLSRHNNIKKFFIDRILRIYPVFTLIHMLIFIAGPIINYEWLSDIGTSDYVIHFISNFLLLPGIFTSLPEAQIVAWSISYEFLFYIIVGLVFWLLYSERKTKYIFITMLIILSLVIMYFHPRALFFIIGILLFKFLDSINRRITFKPYFYFNGLIMFMLIVGTYHLFSIWVSLFLSFLFFITIINEEGLFSKILKTNVFTYLGNISYSLYLWHTFVMFPIKIFIGQVSDNIQSSLGIFVLFTFLSLCFSILVSHYSYQWIEQKFVKYIKGKLSKSKQVINNEQINKAL